MKKLLLNVDTWAGVVSVAWAVLALLSVDKLNELVSYQAAFAFGIVALGRAIKAESAKKAVSEAGE